MSKIEKIIIVICEIAGTIASLMMFGVDVEFGIGFGCIIATAFIFGEEQSIKEANEKEIPNKKATNK